jgi:hypothetical protein
MNSIHACAVPLTTHVEQVAYFAIYYHVMSLHFSNQRKCSSNFATSLFLSQGAEHICNNVKLACNRNHILLVREEIRETKCK